MVPAKDKKIKYKNKIPLIARPCKEDSRKNIDIEGMTRKTLLTLMKPRQLLLLLLLSLVTLVCVCVCFRMALEFTF